MLYPPEGATANGEEPNRSERTRRRARRNAHLLYVAWQQE
jgi:hypothetical protein